MFFRLTGGILPAGVIFICMSFLWLHKVEGTDCSAKSHLNGITFHLHERVSSCNEYNWCVNNTVVANEARFIPMMVLSRDSRSITFKICYDNVTYKNACDGKIINCSSCPTNPATEVQSPRTVDMLMVLFGSYLFVA